ncbi:SpoIVB peptidase [Ruminococcus sp.]|uniref:SpoIVB peptidase n=1 Tax=Ruminococcus sp. TaxID=41978 RepID=UPI0025F69E71|nr:SpoIVB peptidase [Ruminococcus sp.]
MFLKRKIIKSVAALLSVGFIVLFGTAGYYSSQLPSEVTVEPGKSFEIARFPELCCTGSCDMAVPVSGAFSSTEQVTLSLFGIIPVKNVEVRHAEAPVFVVGGRPFGIKLLMEGVMVTGLGDVEDKNGKYSCPAEKAGIRAGDVIRLADGEALTSNDRLQQLISASDGRTVELSVERDGKVFIAELQPVQSRKSSDWKGGMWVRDSIAGIGTMSFFERKTGRFVGLGHPICDSDTGEIVPVHSGEAVSVEITNIRRGARGIPGELRGIFSNEESFGVLERNKASGIYGVLSAETLSELTADYKELPMAYSQEVRTGNAEIYSTISGSVPEKYTVEIEKVDYSNGSNRNMVIRITDKRLLNTSGGIVQGMSGSPIVQDGKLVGAITHVLVSDPARGYGIFAEKMAESIE